jgi:hypothetical protein
MNYKVIQQLEYVADYMEGWKRNIWDRGFLSILRIANYFKKGDFFMNYNGSQQEVGRIHFW